MVVKIFLVHVKCNCSECSIKYCISFIFLCGNLFWFLFFCEYL